MNSARSPSTRDDSRPQSPEPARDVDVVQGQNSTFTGYSDSCPECGTPPGVVYGDHGWKRVSVCGHEWSIESAPAESAGVAVLRQDSPDAPAQHKGLAYPASAGADVVPSTRPEHCEACRIYDVGVAAERERCAQLADACGPGVGQYLAELFRSGK